MNTSFEEVKKLAKEAKEFMELARRAQTPEIEQKFTNEFYRIATMIIGYLNGMNEYENNK